MKETPRVVINRRDRGAVAAPASHEFAFTHDQVRLNGNNALRAYREEAWNLYQSTPMQGSSACLDLKLTSIYPLPPITCSNPWWAMSMADRSF
jgi:hypothetical protein